MIDPRAYFYGFGVAAVVIAGVLAYNWAFDRGVSKEAMKCDAKWAPKVERLQSERLVAQQAAIKAQQQKIAAESALTRELEERSNEDTARIKNLEASNANARRELQRLRDALATANRSLRHLSQPATTATGSTTDGAATGAGDILGACAGRLVDLGEQADRLAAQVVGLQAYARIAQRTCGN